MKILVVLNLIFLSTAALADISSFKGQLYKKSDEQQCLNDLDTVQKNIAALNGYTVLSGGCHSSGKDHIRMEIDYIHPVASRVDTFSVKFATQEACTAAITTSEEEILASGNHFVTTYCEQNTITAHFIDTTFSLVRTLEKLHQFKSERECLDFLSILTEKAEALKMTSFLSYCDSFRPTFNYMAFVDIEMSLIRGKTFTTEEACSNNRSQIEKNFSAQNVKIVYAYCSGLQEMILYLKPKNQLRYLTEYEGKISNSSAICETQLKTIFAGFQTAGKSVLYGFCKMISDKAFMPIVTYTEKINL